MTLAEMKQRRDAAVKAEWEAITRRIEAGTASYADAQRFAGEVGRISGDILSREVQAIFPRGKADRKTIEGFLPPMLRDNHKLVSEVTTKVQQGLNRRKGLHLNAVKAHYNKDRAEGLVTEVVSAEEAATAAAALGPQVENAARSVVDATLRANTEAQFRAGLKPKVIRIAAGNCCKWCSELAGEYAYPGVPTDVWRRHSNCRCVVEYDSGER